jgi:peptide/nickel transport system substrate-binding protein
VPRQEPVDGLAGGRVPRLDRVEWTVISDPATAAGAMTNGEQDYWEYPLHDLLPLLRRSRQVVVQQRLLDGTYGICRFNTLQPPFNNAAIRRAVAMAVDQRDYLTAVAGTESGGWEVCEGVFTCGTALANEAGSEVLKTRSIEKAKAALKEAGYNGERVVLIAPGDYPQINALSMVTADLIRRLGMNLELVSADWGTLIQRRTSKEPVERGGWSIIHTTSSGQSLSLPVFHLFLRANGPQAWFGWPEDAEIERLRAAWTGTGDPAESRLIAEALNRRAMEVMAYVPLGFYWQPSAWARNVTGAFKAPATVFWNLSKA